MKNNLKNSLGNGEYVQDNTSSNNTYDVVNLNQDIAVGFWSEVLDIVILGRSLAQNVLADILGMIEQKLMDLNIEDTNGIVKVVVIGGDGTEEAKQNIQNTFQQINTFNDNHENVFCITDYTGDLHPNSFVLDPYFGI